MINKLKWYFFLVISLCALALCGFVYGQDELSQQDTARFGMARSLLNLEKYDEAKPILTSLHETYPDNHDISFEYAKMLGLTGQIDQSISLFEQLEQKYPDDKVIQDTFMGILLNQKQFDKVRDKYKLILQKNPQNSEYLRKIADVSVWLSDFDTALDYYDRLIAIQAVDESLKLHIADVMFWAKRYADALKLYSECSIGAQSHKTQFVNMAVCYLQLKKFDDAIAAYLELVELYPDNMDFRLTLAGLLHQVGDLDNAYKHLIVVADARPHDLSVAKQMVDILMTSKKYEESVTLLENMLAVNPGDKEIHLYLARVLSWMKRYNDSLQVYDDMIAQYPDWIVPYREKARVLGWMRHYNESVDAYADLSHRFPDSRGVALEGKAKKALFNFYDASVIKYYQELLDYEPENLEALFDLGQAYSRQMQWRNALNMYDQVLAIVPSHFRAELAREKVLLYSSHPVFETDFTYYEADSSDRNVDEQYYRFGSSLRMPFYENIYLGFREDTSIYSSSGFKSLNRQRFMPRVTLQGLPLWKLDFEYQYSLYSDGLDDSHNFASEVMFNPFDMLDTRFIARREDIMLNAQTVRNALRKNDYGFRSVLKPSRRVNIGADYMFSDYNDGNGAHRYGFDVKGMIFYAPTMLSVLYRYEEYGYDIERDSYFSPDSFHFNKLAVEWRHFLNSDELFWGTNDTYYTLRYSVNFDVQHNRGHTLYVDFVSQFNDRMSVGVVWEKLLYEKQYIYSQDRFTVVLKIIF